MRKRLHDILFFAVALTVILTAGTSQVSAYQIDKLQHTCVNLSEYNPADLIAPETVGSNEDVDVSTLLTIDNSDGLIKAEVEDKIRECFVKTYQPLCEMLNNGEMFPVTMKAVPQITDKDAVAYASSDHSITIDASYINDNSDDIDTITHELAHIAQNYYGNIVDTWVVEGIADYARSKVGIQNEAVGWKPEASQIYTNGYQSAAALFLYIEQEYDPDFVSKLNTLIKEDKYSLDLFESMIGTDLDTIWFSLIKKEYGTEEPEIDITLKPSVQVSEDIDISTYLTIEDADNRLDSEVKANIVKMFIAKYASICETYNQGELIPVTLRVDPSYDGVAYTTDGGLIVVSPEYLNMYPEDYDCITHELIHVAQVYGYDGVPVWLTEGIADYGRNQFGVNNAAANWGLGYYETFESNVLKGYRDAASFLRFVEEKYNPDTVKILNQLCKEKKYSHFVWKKITGKNFIKLYEDFKQTTPERLDKNEKLPDMLFTDKDGNAVYLNDVLGKKATIIYIGDWVDDGQLLLYMRPTYRIHKIWGEDVATIYIGLNQQYDYFYSLLDRAGQIYYGDSLYLNDSNKSACSNLLFRKTDDGGWVMSWPTEIILDEEGNIIRATCFYDKINVENDGTEGSIEVQILQQLVPREEPSIEWPYHLEGVYGEEPNTPEEPTPSTVPSIVPSDEPSVAPSVVPSEEPSVAPSTAPSVKPSVAPSIIPSAGADFSDNETNGTYTVSVSTASKKEVSFEKPVDKTKKTISIASTVEVNGEKYKITKIDNGAFKKNVKLKEISVGSNVKSIGKDAFSGATKLSKAKLPKNVEKIGASAFKGCSSLKSLSLGSKVNAIGADAFNGCKTMKTLTIKSTKLTSKNVSKNAFKGLTKKTTIKVPKRKLEAYKELFRKKGLSSKVAVKAY